MLRKLPHFAVRNMLTADVEKETWDDVEKRMIEKGVPVRSCPCPASWSIQDGCCS